MTDFAIPDFVYSRIAGANNASINVAHAGTGPAVVLLHGFPETHVMWSAVARDLSRDYSVIALDLRGYGDSGKPDADTPDVYSKRTMAADVVAIASQLGHERFAVIGHDRGALVAVRGWPGPPGPRLAHRDPRCASYDGYLGRVARSRCQGRLAPLPHGSAKRSAGEEDCRRRIRVLRVLPRFLGPHRNDLLS